MIVRYAILSWALVTMAMIAVGSAAEPTFRIRLRSGNEILADKAWIEGERAFYERYGDQGSVQLEDVDVFIDRELEEQLAQCQVQARDSLKRIEATELAAEDLGRNASSLRERAYIESLKQDVQLAEYRKAKAKCDKANIKYIQNKMAIEAAQKNAGK